MSTTIEWTQRPGTKGETWNPVVGCTKVSQGCKHCYAKRVHDNRHKAFKDGKLQNVKQYAVPFEVVQLMPERLTMPLRWKAPRTVFVNSVSDLFHENVPFAFIDQVFAVMALTPQHTYQVLTKRPGRMAEYLNGTYHRNPKDGVLSHIEQFRLRGIPDGGMHHREIGKTWQWPLPNVWMGTSVEDQATADARIPHLLRCPAAVRFLSCEPLLGVVDLKLTLGLKILPPGPGNKWLYWPLDELHWVITGGESGAGARPMHPDWARSLRDQCAQAGVAFFFKQWGEYRPMELSEVHKGFDAIMVSNSPDRKPSCGYQMPHQLEGYITDTASGYGWQRPMLRVGKHASGNLLDGVEHKAWPKVAGVAEPA
jgi:protein gp37